MPRGGVPGAGRYFYGDFCTGEVWSFRYESGQKSGFRREAFTVPGNLSSFGLGPQGSLLVVSHGGTVYRVAAVAAGWNRAAPAGVRTVGRCAR